MRHRILAALLPAFLASAAWAGVKVLQNVPSTYVYPVDGHIVGNVYRGTQTLLSIMMPGEKFNDPRGVACAFLKSDDDPKDPLDDVEITVVGSNTGASQLFYNASLKKIRKFGSAGPGEGQFQGPAGVAIHPDGTVAVADTGNHRVVLLFHDGTKMTWTKALGGPGTEPGRFNSPRGVAFDSQRNLYVADTGNNRLQVLTGQGRWSVLSTGVPLSAPEGLACIDSKEAWTFHREGPFADRLAVIDQQGQRLLTFGLDGRFLNAAKCAALPNGPATLSGVAFDYYGNAVAADVSRSCLRKFDKELRYLCSFGSEGENRYQFLHPRGIAVNRQLGQVVVAEERSAHYLWVGADADGFAPVAAGTGWRFPFTLTERATLSATVKDNAGRAVTVLLNNVEWEEGKREFAWVPDPALPDGFYTLEFDLMATYSSRERIAKRFTVTLKKSRP
jgi:DNA-binding beta-propeller fold protein YncE